jgi:hypothetical protein
MLSTNWVGNSCSMQRVRQRRLGEFLTTPHDALLTELRVNTEA